MKNMKGLIIINFVICFLILETFFCPVLGTEVKALNVGPVLDEKEIKIIEDYSVRLLAFEMGEIDMVTVLPKDLERISKNRPDAQIVYTRPVYLTMGHLSFNVRETVNGEWNPWSIKELRQAMAHLINRDEVIINSPLQGFAEKATTIVSARYGDWVNPDLTKVDFEIKYPFSLEKASLLLDKAGFIKGTDGWRRDPKTGNILSLKISVLPESVAPELYWMAIKYKTYAEQIGVQVIVDPQPVSVMVAGVMGRTFQSWLWGYYYGAYPTYYYWNYHSKEDRWVDGKPEGINYFGVRNATLDKYLDGFLYTDNFEEAKRNFWKAQEILTDLVPTIPGYLPLNIIAISGKWKNIPLFYAPPYEKPLDI
ncbi:MAG: ABC transporter substrate-binding protein, partial [Sulfolobales archaeon]